MGELKCSNEFKCSSFNRKGILLKRTHINRKTLSFESSMEGLRLAFDDVNPNRSGPLLEVYPSVWISIRAMVLNTYTQMS